jgi:hypothetical protein
MKFVACAGYVITDGGHHVTVESIAKFTHEMNKAYCEAIGDFSQVSWETAASWQRESAKDGVERVLAGTSNTAEEQHDARSKFKIADGWEFGEVKDADAKTHPCLVPYDQLPTDQKAKDFIFRATVAQLLAL